MVEGGVPVVGAMDEANMPCKCVDMEMSASESDTSKSDPTLTLTTTRASQIEASEAEEFVLYGFSPPN